MMKAASSKSEGKKRKRDESQEPISESTKKAKVHAQRKFAQGAAVNSPVITPIKDKVRPPATTSSSGPILSGKCPNTEDFLTFLCFRRTSILPAKLDFFKDAFGSESKSGASTDKTNAPANHKSNSETVGKQNLKKDDKNGDIKGSNTPSVQALRRKYQEQRLAKQKPTNVTTLAKKVKGKNMVRTRASTVLEETKIAVKQQCEREIKTYECGLRSGLKRIQPVASKVSKKPIKIKRMRAGLRSSKSVFNTSAKPVQEKKPTAGVVKKAEKEGKKSKTEVLETKTKYGKGKKLEGFSDFSSDDNEPLLMVKKSKTGGKNVGIADDSKIQNRTTMRTRLRLNEPDSSKVLLRPTRKTKEAAALYMEMITKKLVSPEKSGDEDMSSVDSFPELPNAKRTEQRETEIKAKALAPKKPEPKQQSEDKTKEAKKTSAKKNDQTSKTEIKIVKDSPSKKSTSKKDIKILAKQDDKGETVTSKRSSRSSVKEESAKIKQTEEVVKEQTRPSTRSRPQENISQVKKSLEKVMPKAKIKKNVQKNTDKHQKDKSADSDKKTKIKKEEKTKKKIKTEQNEATDSVKKSSQKNQETKNLDVVMQEKKQEQPKVTRNTGDRKARNKNEVKEKEEIAEKKLRKLTKSVETDTDTKKLKPVEKKNKKDEEEKVSDVVVNKRPTRKCSTADKIWIDIDGFTSDEDDFLEVSPFTKTRSSLKKTNSLSEKPKQKIEVEKNLTKPETTVLNKAKNEKKESGSKIIDKKVEAKKTKVEKKFEEEIPVKATSQVEGKKVETKITKSDEKGNKAAEKQEKTPKLEKKSKALLKAESDSKKTEKPFEEGETKKTNKKTSLTSQQVEKVKEGSKEVKKHKKKEIIKNIEGKGQKKILNKIVKSTQTSTSNKKETESESKMRTRPVRQCSTGEKRWIETDSDSFSFYETSDDEDNLPIVDFSKLKSSPDAKVKMPEEHKSEKKLETNEKEEYNFSESDEEPLKKKAHLEEISDKIEPELKSPEKVQREMPALTPLKKSPMETHVIVNIPPKPKCVKPEPVHVPVIIPAEPNPPLLYESKNLEETHRPLPVPYSIVKQVEIPKILPEPSPVSVPNRIEMILHSLKRDKITESTPSHSNDVKVTFGNVPYQPVSYSSQTNQISCTYQVKATFPSPREPISTHGLDLLSEVALPTTPMEGINSQTKRIEKWLNDNLAADQKTQFSSFENNEYKTEDRASQSVSDKSQPEAGYYFGKQVVTSSKVASSQSEFQKFGQVELLESQKLLKKNLFAVEVKQDSNKVDQQQQYTPKKTVTSVQDLLKLQKERKEIAKTAENVPHLKNCKCNNCVVKKGWFKNKPLPKTDQQKSSSAEEQEESSKPFESLTKAFIGEGKNSKMAVSVAPMVVSPPLATSVSKIENDKKGVFQQRKLSFLERMKERERKEAAASTKATANAFSPNNESSVYAFEPEPEQSVGVNAPFRSKTRESRTPSASRSDDEGLKICEDETSTTSSTTQAEKPNTEKSVKSSQSASIAVQVNLDSETVAEVDTPPEFQDGKSIEISTQTEVPEEDSDSPMFYIPLQQATTSGASASSDQQLIQGVALKLGTEGPMGPNQRVIMKAKLVTKPPDSPSIKAVVMPQPKRMFDQKYNNPPIGTVQPTTRKPPDEQVSDKSETAKAEIAPAAKAEVAPEPKAETAKESSEPILQSADSEVSKMIKNISSNKTLKNKEKIQTMSKDKGEVSDENSPCSSSSSSTKLKKLNKQKSAEPSISPTNSTWLPPAGTPPKLVEAPTFHPTEKDFQDPFEFFDRIRLAAEKFGLCRIVPPSNFKPDCKVSDDMRFTAYNQYVHRMFHRWGPNIKEMMAIKKYLATQSISLKQPPWIGGIEVDLPRLYQSVQTCGGLMKVMEKKKWHQVADLMKIPKAAQDRVTKLDDIYCKYLLPYDTLSHDERQKLFDEVEKDWEERQKIPVESQDSQEEEESEENYIEECEECVVKGRNMALNQFYRIARNTMTMWFRNPEPSPREVENEFWKHVSERNHHVCVHSGSIDSRGWGYGFPITKNNSFSKHPWNLKVLTNNSGSVLRYLGPVMGVTVPTLHVGMVFTAFCWYRDPHGLPWIEYLHTGAPKIWYGISDDNSTVFQEALTKLLPRYIKNKTIWLPSDTAMIPPELLVEHGVSLCHTVQEPGQFILVFPRAFTSSICTGYLVSESVYFAQLKWLTTAEQVFKDIQESCEPSMFSLEKLLFSIATDSRSSVEVLKQVLPMVWHVRQKEIDGRKTLCNLGLKSSERLPARELGNKKKKGRWAQEDDGDYECEICRTNLYVSLVTNSQEEGVYCLPHAIELLTQKRHQLKHCKLMYTYTQEEMNEMVEKLEQKIESKSQKKPQSKPSTSAK